MSGDSKEPTKEGNQPSRSRSPSPRRSHSWSRSRSRSRSYSRGYSYSRSRSPVRLNVTACWATESHQPPPCQTCSPCHNYHRNPTLPSKTVDWSKDCKSPSHPSRSRIPERSCKTSSASPRRGRRSSSTLPWRKKLDDFLQTSKEVSWSGLESKAKDMLERLSDKEADCVVSRFIQSNFARVTNPSGFLMGIIRRVEQEGVDNDSPADFDKLPRRVRKILQGLIDEKRLADVDVDKRMCQVLLELSEEQAVMAVEKFAATSLETIRSKTGFMISIIRRLGTTIPHGDARGASNHAASPATGGNMGYYAAAYGHQAMMVGFGGMYGGYPFYAPGYGGASYVPYAYPTYVGANGADLVYYGARSGFQGNESTYIKSRSRSKSRGRRQNRDRHTTSRSYSSRSRSRGRSHNSRSWNGSRSPSRRSHSRSPRRRSRSHSHHR